MVLVMHRLQMRLPVWMQEWLEVLVPGVQIFLIIFVAWLLNWLFKRIVSRVGKAYDLPHELLMPLRGVLATKFGGCGEGAGELVPKPRMLKALVPDLLPRPTVRLVM